MTATTTIDDEATILGRAIRPEEGDWPADIARSMLPLRLSDKDVVRMNELAELARHGSLSLDEEIEIENYRRAARLLAMLKAKAQLSLRQAGSLP